MGKPLQNLEDEYKWSKETAQALRCGNLSAVDMDSLIDELESVYIGMERQLSEYLEDVFKAKLHLDFVNSEDGNAELMLTNALTELNNLFWAAPSVSDALTQEVIDEAYQNIRQRIAPTIEKPIPEKCPYDRQSILNAVSALEFAA
jgi:hypothetical protein